MNRLLVAGIAAGLCSCSLLPPTIEPGTTTESRILSTYGKPSYRTPGPDNTTTLVYATQPEGVSCLMVDIDAQGRVVNAREALGEHNQWRVRAGMDQDQVTRLLGPHRSEEYFPLSGELVWDWNVPHTGPGIATRFNVHFKYNVVVRTSRTYVLGGAMGGTVVRLPMALPCPRCQP